MYLVYKVLIDSMEDKKPAPKVEAQPGDGIRSLRSTSLFRAVNFELYAKPVSSLKFSESYLNLPSIEFKFKKKTQ